MTTWFLLVFTLARTLFLDFQFQRYDLGNMVQAVWSTADGRFLETTLGTGEQESRMAAHVDPLLALLTPVWILVPSPLTLVAVQIAACSVGALPVFWLARRHVTEAAAGLLALAYLANPWLAWAALDAIHPVTLAIPLVLFAILFLDSNRLFAFALASAAVAAAGELAGIPIACLGVWYWIERGNRRVGLTIMFLGLSWTWVCLNVVIPFYWGGESQFYGLYDQIGGSPVGVIRTALTEPGAIANQLFTSGDAAFLLALAAPFAGAFLLSPVLGAAALPQLAANTLSSLGGHLDPRIHTVSLILPFLMAATVLGIARLGAPRATVAATIVLAMSIGMSVAVGVRPGPGAYAAGAWYFGTPPSSRAASLREAVRRVPSGVPVAATTKAGSHLSARRFFYSLPMIGRAEWVVIDLWDPWIPVRTHPSERKMWGSFNPDAIERVRARLRSDSNWRLVFGDDGVFVFKRVSMADFRRPR